MCREAPERNEKLAGECDDRDPSQTTAVGPDALLKPVAQRRSRLMTKPQPGGLDHRGTEARITRLRDPLFPLHVADSPGTWR